MLEKWRLIRTNQLEDEFNTIVGPVFNMQLFGLRLCRLFGIEDDNYDASYEYIDKIDFRRLHWSVVGEN